jgi:TRAP-type C4-dicarboxylate transport system substrate-binding protein
MKSRFSLPRVRCTAWVVAMTLAAGTLLVPSAASAQTTTIKMATSVPTNSSWFLVLKEVADKWSKLSNGRVRVILYGGGTKGDEPEVVAAMRLGELQGAVLTSVGIAEIEKSVYAVSIPMAYDSYEEAYFVLDRLRSRLEAAIDAKGFVVLNWADAGWVHFFSTKPVGLSTGLFEACSMSPQVAQIGRYYEKAKYMTDLNWALLLGATVIKKETWAQVPADVKPALLKAMQEAGAKLQADIRRSGETDVAAMKTAGLTVVPIDARTKELWRKTAETAYGKVRGDFVPADAFDEAMKARDDFRKLQAAAPKK